MSRAGLHLVCVRLVLVSLVSLSSPALGQGHRGGASGDARVSYMDFPVLALLGCHPPPAHMALETLSRGLVHHAGGTKQHPPRGQEQEGRSEHGR